MQKKGLKLTVLTIILGVPVIWYLFLQSFGTNEFELPTLGNVKENCKPTSLAVVLFNTPESTAAKNQFSRIEQNYLTKDLINKGNRECRFEDWDLILVNEIGDIKGAYRWNIAEIDRLITEVELYHEIEKRNGARNSK